MKLLNNPWVVGSLCVIAVGVAGYQVLKSRSRASQSPAPTVAVPPTVAPRPSTLTPQLSTTSTPAAGPVTFIDRVFVQSHFAQWLQAPRRDPFLWATAGERGASASSPISQWKLNSIWNQTGCRLAVINNRVYAEGDMVEGYRLETIERDGVWLRGPTGREGLGFGKPKPPTASITNLQSTVTNHR